MVDFAGGYLSSDGGGLFLRELEVRSGLLRELSECFIDRRDQRFVEHSVQSLINQRVNGLVLGYEDLNDHDELRRDPLHGLIAGKSDPSSSAVSGFGGSHFHFARLVAQWQ